MRLSTSALPVETVEGWLRDSKGNKYARLHYKKVMFEGGHGTLQLCLRTDLSGQKVETLVKKPHTSIDLSTEALLQWAARGALKSYKLERHIPRVYDIFTTGRETRFSMEFIRGDFPHKYLEKVAHPDIFFFQLLAQICVILHILETVLFMDHRDLKTNNLYVREEAVDLVVLDYHIKAPFRVVILDFGFACVGNESGLTRINVGSNVFPATDPCPKEGRDLFHLITSFCSIPSVYNILSESTQRELDGWLTRGKQNFVRVSQKFQNSQWVYVLTSTPDFAYPKLNPLAILERLTQLGLIFRV